jgi:hypothetical protein
MGACASKRSLEIHKAPSETSVIKSVGVSPISNYDSTSSKPKLCAVSPIFVKKHPEPTKERIQQVGKQLGI